MKHTHTFKQVWCLRMCVCGGVREGGEKVGNTRSCHVVTTALFFRACLFLRASVQWGCRYGFAHLREKVSVGGRVTFFFFFFSVSLSLSLISCWSEVGSVCERGGREAVGNMFAKQNYLLPSAHVYCKITFARSLSPIIPPLPRLPPLSSFLIWKNNMPHPSKNPTTAWRLHSQKYESLLFWLRSLLTVSLW